MKNKWILNKNDVHCIIILVAAILIAIKLYLYALSFPMEQRIRGDAYQYLSIANSFKSLSDAIFYVGDRTYGFPLFLYVIKKIFSPTNVNEWSLHTSYVQFIFHILTVLYFLQFFIKKILRKFCDSNILPSLVAAIIIVYPPLVTYTSISLTDTFCADLIMWVAILYYAFSDDKKTPYLILIALLCGLILGYAIMVRPSFWPPSLMFLVGGIFELFLQKNRKKVILLKIASIALGISMLLAPTVRHIWQNNHTIGIVNPTIFKNATQNTLQDGLAGVRIFWSGQHPSSKLTPGIYDPMLKQKFYNQCKIHSFSEWAICLSKDPLFIPVYFAKKILSLFDVPHLQSYTVDTTPHWFSPFARIFGMLSFCGVVSLIILIAHQKALNMLNSTIWPIIFFISTLILLHAMGHVEGRYAFASVPFLILFLFLGLLQLNHMTKIWQFFWIYAVTTAGLAFLYQTYQWDFVLPI